MNSTANARRFRREQTKEDSGMRCGRDVLPDSSSVANIRLGFTLSISIVRPQSSRSNWTAFNTECPSNINEMRSDKCFWLPKELKNYASGIINGKRTAKASCWKFGTHC